VQAFVSEALQKIHEDDSPIIGAATSHGNGVRPDVSDLLSAVYGNMD